MARDDDDQKPIKSNAAPEPKPPGISRSDHAPPGAIGHVDGMWHRGPLFIVGSNPDPFGDKQSGAQPEQPRPRPDKSIPRVPITGDPEVDFHYGQQEVLVGKDGTEFHPGEYAPESEMAEENQPEQGDRSEAEHAHEQNGMSEGQENDPRIDQMFERDDHSAGTEDDPRIDQMLDKDDPEFNEGPSEDGPERDRDRSRGR